MKAFCSSYCLLDLQSTIFTVLPSLHEDVFTFLVRSFTHLGFPGPAHTLSSDHGQHGRAVGSFMVSRRLAHRISRVKPHLYLSSQSIKAAFCDSILIIRHCEEVSLLALCLQIEAEAAPLVHTAHDGSIHGIARAGEHISRCCCRIVFAMLLYKCSASAQRRFVCMWALTSHLRPLSRTSHAGEQCGCANPNNRQSAWAGDTQRPEAEADRAASNRLQQYRY